MAQVASHQAISAENGDSSLMIEAFRRADGGVALPVLVGPFGPCWSTWRTFAESQRIPPGIFRRTDVPPVFPDLASQRIRFDRPISRHRRPDDSDFHFQHADNDRCDRRKDLLLQRQGFVVMRFPAEDVAARMSEIVASIIDAGNWRRAEIHANTEVHSLTENRKPK